MGRRELRAWPLESSLESSLADGTVRRWGGGLEGQLGDGTDLNRSSPVAVAGLTGVDLLPRSASSHHSCARRTDGSAWCWGNNFDRERGVASVSFSALQF